MQHTRTPLLSKIIIFGILPLLGGCGSTPSATSFADASSAESLETSDQATSSIDEFDSTGDEKIDDFLKQLEKYHDHPNYDDVNMIIDNYYMMAGTSDYMTMHISDIFEITRYTLNEDSDITVREGTYTIEESTSDYTTQVYGGGHLIYCLTDYKDENDQDTKQTISYTKDGLEDSLAINFSYKEVSNLRYLASVNDGETAVGEYTLPESLPETGEFSYTYALYIYEEGYLSQKVSHDVTVDVENNYIVSSKQIVENDLFGGTRQKVNYSVSTTEVTYSQGEYETFTGDVFDPKSFVEIE